MFAMIADWHQSGLSKKRYCEENGVNEATFYYWFSRSKENDTASGSFVAMDNTGRKGDVEVYLPQWGADQGRYRSWSTFPVDPSLLICFHWGLLTVFIYMMDTATCARVLTGYAAWLYR